jgi:TerD domain
MTLALGGGFTLDPSVRKLRVGLSWDAGVDVDSSAVSFNADLVAQQCVYFGNLNSSDGSISHRLKFSFFRDTGRCFFPVLCYTITLLYFCGKQRR